MMAHIVSVLKIVNAVEYMFLLIKHITRHVADVKASFSKFLDWLMHRCLLTRKGTPWTKEIFSLRL